jgi:Ca2+-binding RTX toxin-like protein
MANAGTFELTGVVAGEVTVSMKDATGSADSLNIKLNGTANVVNTGTLTVSGVETINIEATDSSADTTTLTNPAAAATINLVAAAATKIVVTGNHGVNFTGSTLTNVVSLDATGVVSVGNAAGASSTQIGTTGAVTFTSAVTNQNVTVSTGNGADVINVSSVTDATKTTTVSTGAGNDTVTGSAGKDAINLGAGNDTVNSSGSVDSITLGDGNDIYVLGNVAHSVVAARDVITDFKANTVGQGAAGAVTTAGATATAAARNGDVINIDAVNAAFTVIRVGVLGNAADAQTFIQNGAGAAEGANTVNAALDSTTGYLYLDTDDNGVVDSVIELTGVTTINAAAFVLA